VTAEFLYAYSKQSKAAINPLRRASYFLKKKVNDLKPVIEYPLKSCKKDFFLKAGSFLNIYISSIICSWFENLVNFLDFFPSPNYLHPRMRNLLK